MAEDLTEEKIEEYLEAVWLARERDTSGVGYEEVEDIVNLEFEGLAELREKLEEEGYLVSAEGEVELSPSGEQIARNVIRRHRLAERLFVDILDMDFSEIEGPACQFEHAISHEVEEKMCTLLGHPEECPHGKPIPRGNCCRRSDEVVESVIRNLAEMEIGRRARVVYISLSDEARLQKLSSYGLLPGTVVKVIQKFPSFLVQIEEVQLAMEKEVARNIQVREIEGGSGSEDSGSEGESLWKKFNLDLGGF